MAEDDLSKQFRSLCEDWREAIANKRHDWFERHFSEDFLGTAQPWPKLSVDKRQMIDLDKAIEKMDVRWLDVTAQQHGDTVLTVGTVQYIDEVFKPGAVVAEGMPTGQQLSDLTNGKTVLYIGAWRHNGSVWQIFDHHMVGIV